MSAPRQRIAVATGSRAEFGLLDPVMRAIRDEPALELQVVVSGAHLLPPAETWRDVSAAGFDIAAVVEMQRPGESGRTAEAVAAGRGVEGFARAFAKLGPRWVVVLGDRIEAFAAAAAASIAGIAVAHLHGGDRAEGIADEALRHAVTKLAHLHLAATEESARRIVRMGERPESVRVVGSPAVDGLDRVEPMSDDEAAGLTDPAAVFLMHASGLDESAERLAVRAALEAAASAFPRRTILCFAPNHDPGRDAILDEIRRAAEQRGWPIIDHLPRMRFLALLKRLARRDGLLIGNSSAALIEAAALCLPAVNIGSRQNGRERPNNIIDAQFGDSVPSAIQAALRLDRAALAHPYGDGHAGRNTANAILTTEAVVRKRCSY